MTSEREAVETKSDTVKSKTEAVESESDAVKTGTEAVETKTEAGATELTATTPVFDGPWDPKLLATIGMGRGVM